MSVADFGVGMTGDEAARCFEPFWQAAGRRGGGAGIGLYIVRSLVDAMGGHLGVRTAPNKGSTFTFSLPRSEFAAKRANSPAESPGLGDGTAGEAYAEADKADWRQATKAASNEAAKRRA